jgi:hypothetical protein
MVCDEGSQLVKLLGQIRNTEKVDHIQNDEIIESLMDEETNEYLFIIYLFIFKSKMQGPRPTGA